MMEYGAEILLERLPFLHDPDLFPRMWQQVAALGGVIQFVKEGKVLGPTPCASARSPTDPCAYICPL